MTVGGRISRIWASKIRLLMSVFGGSIGAHLSSVDEIRKQQNGKVEKQDLINDPFTRIHPKGIRGIFEPGQIDEIVAFTEKMCPKAA